LTLQHFAYTIIVNSCISHFFIGEGLIMASFLGTGSSNPGDVYTMGKLGVGTTPSATLDVVGNFKVGGTQIVNQNGFLTPKLSSAAGATTNSLYIDPTDAKLYFKDSGGTSHALYS
jgi:hypothetical protein